MTANITSVTVTFGHGIKREEYGPTKKAEVSITASVSETEDGAVILTQIGSLALAKVADLLNAPKPDTVSSTSIQEANAGAQADPPPARRGRGPNKPKDAPASGEPAAAGSDAPLELTDVVDEKPAEDEWAAGAADIEVTDAELLSATSARAQAIGARDPIVKLIATFATRTEGAPFKVQEIPQNQRKDYLTKLAALTA